MKCTNCQQELPEESLICPHCGADNGAVQQVEEQLSQEGEAVVMITDPEHREDESQVEAALATPQVKKMKRIAMISGCLALLAVLGTVLFFGIWGGKLDLSFLYSWMIPRDSELLGNETYTFSDRDAWNRRDKVVATAGDGKLTNATLQVYYWMEVYNFMNSENGYMMMYYGMIDLEKPLEEQMSPYDDGTWQQHFLKQAISSWHSAYAMTAAAKADGFTLSGEHQAYLDGLRESLEASAQKDGFADAQAYVQDSMGPGSTVEAYIEYETLRYTSLYYFGEKYEAINPTKEEVDAYFAAHESEFLAEGIGKNSGKYYTLRHIQINVKGGTKDEEGNLVYSDAEWSACRDEAQKVMDAWLADPTEAAFGTLAKSNSADSATASNGGLLENTKLENLKATYGEGFATWASNAGRQKGDYELVRSDKGYHLIYYVSSVDIWYTGARQALIQDLNAKIVSDAMEACILETDYSKAALGAVELAK